MYRLKDSKQTAALRRSTCEHSRNSNVKVLFTDANESYSNERQKLKVSFIEKEKNQVGDYLSDIEKTLKINKEIVSELLKNDKNSSTYKTVSEKLNSESILLHNQLSKCKKEREDTQAKLLISEQIIQEYKTKEEDTKSEFEQTKKELLDQLSRKEYILQLQERRYLRLEEILKKCAKSEPEVWKTLKAMNLEIASEPKKIENVIEENENLNKKINELQIQVKNLQTKIEELAQENSKKSKEIENLLKNSENKPKSPIPLKNTIKITSQKNSSIIKNTEKVPQLDFSKLQKYSATITNHATYIHKLEDTIKDKNSRIIELKSIIDSLKEKSKKQESEMSKLFDTNQKLSDALQNASQKLDSIKNKSFINKSALIMDQIKSTEDSKLQTASTKTGRAQSFLQKNTEKLSIDFGAEDSHEKNIIIEPIEYNMDLLNKSFGEISGIEEINSEKN